MRVARFNGHEVRAKAEVRDFDVCGQCTSLHGFLLAARPVRRYPPRGRCACPFLQSACLILHMPGEYTSLCARRSRMAREAETCTWKHSSNEPFAVFRRAKTGLEERLSRWPVSGSCDRTLEPVQSGVRAQVRSPAEPGCAAPRPRDRAERGSPGLARGRPARRQSRARATALGRALMGAAPHLTATAAWQSCPRQCNGDS
jgi:hypothetical protein